MVHLPVHPMAHRVVMLATASLVAACSHGPVAPHLRDPGLDLTLDQHEASSGDSVGFSITFSLLDAPGDPVYLHLAFDAKPTAGDTLTVPPSQEPLHGTFIVDESQRRDADGHGVHAKTPRLG